MDLYTQLCWQLPQLYDKSGSHQSSWLRAPKLAIPVASALAPNHPLLVAWLTYSPFKVHILFFSSYFLILMCSKFISLRWCQQPARYRQSHVQGDLSTCACHCHQLHACSTHCHLLQARGGSSPQAHPSQHATPQVGTSSSWHSCCTLKLSHSSLLNSRVKANQMPLTR